MNRIGRVMLFIAGSVICGLALAFLIVAWRPQVLGHRPACARRDRPRAGGGRNHPPRRTGRHFRARGRQCAAGPGRHRGLLRGAPGGALSRP